MSKAVKRCHCYVPVQIKQLKTSYNNPLPEETLEGVNIYLFIPLQTNLQVIEWIKANHTTS